MSLLFRVVVSTACRGTHHKLAMDALRHLRGPDAETWRNLFLKNYENYLSGSKAPDDRFKDFKNHVLHVAEGFWGGAEVAATQWYDKAVAFLRERNWPEAAFAAGVLSHYFSDPLMPFHTGQTEEEGKVHRAAEWSIACSYAELLNIIERDLGYPPIDVPAGPDWLAAMVRQGAAASNRHYHTIIDHYDLARGVKNPTDGLDQEIKDRIAGCLAHAIAGFARILERAFADAAVSPPTVSLSIETILATLKVPVRWVTQKMADAGDRALVEKIYDEVRRTGKAIDSLPEDDREVRRLHAEEVLKRPLPELDVAPARPSGQQHGDGASPRLRLGRPNLAPVKPPIASPISRPKIVPVAAAPPEPPPVPVTKKPKVSKPRMKKAPVLPGGPRLHLRPEDPLPDAPTIGAKSAKQFEAVGVRTVADLLAADPADLAARLGVKRFDAAALREIQAQANLVCRIPGLRGHDAQVLVACGITDPAILAAMNAEELAARLAPFLATSAADRLLRSSPKPNQAEMAEWIEFARNREASRAA